MTSDKKEGWIVVGVTGVLIPSTLWFIVACALSNLSGHAIVGAVNLAVFVVAFVEGWRMSHAK